MSEEPKECKDKKATECTIDIDSCDDNNRRDNNDEIQEIASNSESEAEKELKLTNVLQEGLIIEQASLKEEKFE
ncbi:10996_t:CDS:1, partial [Paraglomus brasilianum]